MARCGGLGTQLPAANKYFNGSELNRLLYTQLEIFTMHITRNLQDLLNMHTISVHIPWICMDLHGFRTLFLHVHVCVDMHVITCTDTKKWHACNVHGVCCYYGYCCI